MAYDEISDGKHTANTGDFWKEIAQKLNAIKKDTTVVKIFSQYEKDKINLLKRLSPDQKTAAQTDFLHSHELSLIFIENLSHNNRMFLVMAACTLGLPVPEEYADNFQDYGLEQGTSKAIRIVEKAIQKEDASFDFIRAWAEINDAYGFISALTGGDKGNYHYLDKRYLNGTAGNIIEQHMQPQPFKTACDILEAKALFESSQDSVYLRVAPENGRVVINLSNTDCQVVVIGESVESF